MEIIHPNTPTLITQRDNLLQISMRSEPLPYSIDREYPIVLNPSNYSLSYCGLLDKKVIAHANLWPRDLEIQQTQIKVGLVGNVASHNQHRGQGHIKTLLTHLTNEAIKNQWAALILWSDLTQFYQKLGFSSVGSEYRFTLTEDQIDRLEGSGRQFIPTDSKTLTKQQLNHLITIRHKTPGTLSRTFEEFSQLLTIPECHLFCQYNGDEITGFIIVGKGYDMGGVIHEWGCIGVNDIQQAAFDARLKLDLPFIMLLSPVTIEKTWVDALFKLGATIEKHPMALLKILDEKTVSHGLFDKSFIWGLDSI